MPRSSVVSRIHFLMNQIENRLSELSPETLLKVESALGFAVFQMDAADVINADIITEKESE